MDTNFKYLAKVFCDINEYLSISDTELLQVSLI